MAKFLKGHPGGPGRPRDPTRLDRMVVFDIKQVARGLCEEAMERLAEHMRSDDERVSLAATIAIIERGYGRPEQRADATVTHKFAIVPEVMSKSQWLEHRGQPQPKTVDLKAEKPTNGSSH